MPEGDTIFRAARTLNRALGGKAVTKFETALAQLARTDDDTSLAGRVIERVDALGKWMRIWFSGDLILVTHMLMSGSWHIYRPGEKWQRPRSQMRAAIHTQDFVAVAFQVPIAEFHTAASLARHRSVQRVGPDLLAPEFDVVEAAARIRSRPDLETGTALLQQSLVAGMGNVFKSEVCFASRVNPFRRIATLTDPELELLLANARRFLLANVTEGSEDRMRRTTERMDREENLWVYQRRTEPCRRCGTPILARKQGEDAHITFWCPHCQPI